MLCRVGLINVRINVVSVSAYYSVSTFVLQWSREFSCIHNVAPSAGVWGWDWHEHWYIYPGRRSLELLVHLSRRQFSAGETCLGRRSVVSASISAVYRSVLVFSPTYVAHRYKQSFPLLPLEFIWKPWRLQLWYSILQIGICAQCRNMRGWLWLPLSPEKDRKGKEEYLYSAFYIHVLCISQSAQAWITQFYLQIHHACLCQSTTFIRLFVLPDRYCYHDISWTSWNVLVKLTGNIH